MLTSVNVKVWCSPQQSLDHYQQQLCQLWVSGVHLRERDRERGREGGREGERQGERQGGRNRGRKGGREIGREEGTGS